MWDCCVCFSSGKYVCMKKRTILFVGGGTMGPVTPLIAVARRMKALDSSLSFAWAGTPNGPEQPVIEAEGISFYSVPIAKIARHPSTTWLTWPWRYVMAGVTAWNIVRKVQPILVVSAGGFTAVPIIRSAVRRSIPCAIHQLDAEPGLSNVLVAKRCVSVTTSFEYDFDPFDGVTSTRIATPCRFAGSSVPQREDAAKRFGLQPEKPIVLIVGGGTGATTLNEAVWKMKSTLLKTTQIIHSTGKGKALIFSEDPGYVMREFFDEDQLRYAYAAADLVVSRAGIGGISDLACLSKPAIFVPIPKSHQELNVKKLPCAVVEQGEGFSERLQNKILSLLQDDESRRALGTKLHDAFPTDNGTELAKRLILFLT